MKKLLIVGLGVVLMGMQVNVLAATCVTEKKGKGYTLRVLSPGPGTVINKGAPFLLQWQDPAQSLGIKVHVGLHQLKGTKKVPKPIKTLMNRPNTGNVLVTGTNLTQPGPKAKARDKYFLRITSGKTKQFIDSECFAFAPALKGIPKQAADAEQQGFQLTMQAYATEIAALRKELAAVKKQLAAKGTGGSGGGAQGPKGDKGDTGPQGPAGKDGAGGGGGGLTEAQVNALIAKHISVSGSAALPQNYGCG